MFQGHSLKTAAGRHVSMTRFGAPMPRRDPPLPLLEVQDLEVAFATDAGPLRAVDGVSFAVDRNRTLGLVGESGCGKSVSALAVLRLIPNPPGRITAGRVLWKERDLLRLPARQLPAIRGAEIAMIFQDPMTSLNPVFTIEQQLGEVLRIRFGQGRRQARARAREMLATVGIADPDRRLQNYPHELSGGMKQRIMIAMALLAEPDLLIADEPTTALDVTIQAQILALIRELQQRTGMAMVLITHDLGVVAGVCDEVAVMYAGRIVEHAPSAAIFENSQHPYTRGLLASIPRKGRRKESRLATIEGVVPSLLEPPPGCRFAERCPRRRELPEADQRRCRQVDPELLPVAGTPNAAACHYPCSGERR